jgi:hypothetical protein
MMNKKRNPLRIVRALPQPQRMERSLERNIHRIKYDQSEKEGICSDPEFLRQYYYAK